MVGPICAIHPSDWRPLEACCRVTVDMVVQRRDGPRRLRDNNDNYDESISLCMPKINKPVRRPTYRELKCADTIGTVQVPWSGHFQC